MDLGTYVDLLVAVDELQRQIDERVASLRLLGLEEIAERLEERSQ